MLCIGHTFAYDTPLIPWLNSEKIVFEVWYLFEYIVLCAFFLSRVVLDVSLYIEMCELQCLD